MALCSKALSGLAKLKGLLVAFLMLLACLLIYANTIHSPFTLDDRPFIQNDKHIQITKITAVTLSDAARYGQPRYRPLSNISFAINYYFSGNHPAGFHVVNILIHGLAGIFLFFFIYYTLLLSARLPRIKDFSSGLSAAHGLAPGMVAFLGAMLWLVHPVHTESVTYVCQRMTSLAAMFYLLSMLFYLKGRMAVSSSEKFFIRYSLWFFGCFAAGVSAIAAKPNAATLPLMIGVYEFLFFQKLSKGGFWRHALGFAALAVVFCFIAFIFLGHDPIGRIFSAYQYRGFTLLQRVLTEPRVVVYYLSLIVFPYAKRLNLDYDYPLSHALFSPSTAWLSILAIILLFGMAVYSAGKDRFLALGVLWFLINLLIESSVIGLEIIFEHRTYLPSMVLIAAIAALALRYIRPVRAVAGLLCLLIFVCSFQTYQRNRIWQDEAVLWADCVKKSPQKARSHYNLGCVLIKRDVYDKTFTHFNQAARLNPDFPQADYNMGFLLAKKELYARAAAYFAKALAIDPDYADAHNNLANALSKMGQSGLALLHYRQAVKLRPNNPDFQTNLAKELFSAKDYTGAIRHYKDALKLAPGNVNILNKLGYALYFRGDINDAVSCYEKALEISSDNAEAHGKMGDALFKKGDVEAAIDHYLKALALNPSDAQSHYNLGVAYLRIGNIKQAVNHFHAAEKTDPHLSLLKTVPR